MNDRNYLLVTMVVFDLVALLQLVRFIMGWPVNIAGFEVPLAASAVAFLVAGGLSAWAFVLWRKRPG